MYCEGLPKKQIFLAFSFSPAFSYAEVIIVYLFITIFHKEKTMLAFFFYLTGQFEINSRSLLCFLSCTQIEA